MKPSFIQNIHKFITDYSLLEKKDLVLVAISGGPDSMALLHVLLALREDFGLRLVLAHLEHGIRGQESLDQAAFIADLGKQLALDCYIHYHDVPAFQKRMKYSLEEAARIARYEFLHETAQRVLATKIALGHNADDQAETLLMRLLRGAGLNGLAAMSPLREGTPPLIRPLLTTFRSDINAFLEDQHIPFCLDSTNQKPICLRNKIRLKLIPLLKNEYNPRIMVSLHKTATLLSEEREWKRMIIEERFQACLCHNDSERICFDLDSWLNLPKGLQKEVIRRGVHQLSPSFYMLDFLKVSLIHDWIHQEPQRGFFHLGPKLRLRKQPGKLWIEKEQPKGLVKSFDFSYELIIPGETSISELGVILFSQVYEKGDLVITSNQDKAYLDFDLLTPPLLVRTRRNGDRFYPLGLRGTKKLKDFFIDAKIPQEARAKIPLILFSNIIVWVGGLRIAEPFKVTAETKRVLVIEKMK